MTPDEVVARIRAVGGRMLEGPRLWLPKTAPSTARHYIMSGLQKFKEEIVALLPPEPPATFRQPALTMAEQCSRCRLLVFEYDGDADSIWESCRLLPTASLLCPYLRSDHPALSHKERRWREWELKKMAEAAKRESDPIPE